MDLIIRIGCRGLAGARSEEIREGVATLLKNHGLRVDVIEESRLTASDARALEAVVMGGVRVTVRGAHDGFIGPAGRIPEKGEVVNG